MKAAFLSAALAALLAPAAHAQTAKAGPKGPAVKAPACPCGCGCDACGCTAGKASKAAPVAADALKVPAVMEDARRWQINGVGSYTTAEVRARGLAIPGEAPACVGGSCGLPAGGYLTVPGSCPGGQCPAPAATYRRFR